MSGSFRLISHGGRESIVLSCCGFLFWGNWDYGFGAFFENLEYCGSHLRLGRLFWTTELGFLGFFVGGVPGGLGLGYVGLIAAF